MQRLNSGWLIETDRGPDCLFVRLHGDGSLQRQESQLALELTALLDQTFAHRLFLELDDLAILRSNIIGQLVLLNNKVSARGGMMRLCGLTDACKQTLHQAKLDTCLPHYRDRDEALMGHRPPQPK